MSKKKGAVIAIIVFIAGFSVLVAYSATLYRQEQVVPEPTINTVDHSQLTANDSGPADGSTTIAENNAEQLPPVANGTIITNSTIVINKPVYNNNTMIYQPVKIHLEDYKATINQNVEVENNQARSSAKPSTGKTFSITIHTQSNPSDGSSEKLADDKVGMFIAVYDIKGKLVKSGFASENGFTVKGLQNSLYFVYPADCNNCNHSRNDIIFGEWEDGSKARPRLIPAGSDVTAIYNIEMEKAKETTKQAPAEETETSSAPEIKLKATDATYVYGWVQVDVQFVNKVQGYDDVLVKVFAPNGTLQDSFNYSDQQGFFTPRQAGEGDYRIVATYKYDKFTAKDEITHQVKFATPEFVNLAATADNGTVRLSGLMKGGLAGENVSIAIHDSDNTVVKKYNATFGTRPVISLFIGSEDAGAIFNKTGNYTFIVTHLETGTHGSATLFYDAGRNTTIANTSVNLSGNSGKSERPDIAVSGDNIYAVWQDDTSAQQQVMFTKSTDGGFTFDKPVIISKSQQGGFSNAPDIAVSGDNVYVVWADYDSEELAAVAFRSSTDGGRTFDNMTVLGNYTGETPKPQVVVNNDVIYVSWITGAIEEFTGNLMLAQSTDGGSKFETKLMAENVSDAVAVGAGNNLYLAWRYFPSGETSNDTGIANIFAAGNESQAIPELQKMTIYSMTASDDAIYIAGTVGDSVVLAQSIGRANFSTTTIGTGILPDVATSGGKVYVTWEQDGKIYIATSKDGGTTFSN
ncbi:MAG TPA: sialidase family protein, partial [Nitrososphaera sp.]|nr:sialidase family protein [Nitrososphaera sp.]